ncbi:MAG: M16 family metallopeptidase [Rhodobacterales bacterium]
MKPFAAAALSLAVLAGCQEDDKPAAYTETSPGGIEYVRLFIPAAKDVAIQLAWPSNWAFRDDVNQAVPYIGTDLILDGGAEGFPAGEVVETYADLEAEGSLWVTSDHVHGELIVAKENLAKAVEIAAAHLARPTLDQGWFDRIQQGFAANMAEGNAQPASRGAATLRWAILGDTALRRALSVDPPDMITSATADEVRDWHRQTIVRTGAKIVVAGEIDADAAGTAVDPMLSGLPEADTAVTPEPKADFAPRRILLHVPEAQTSTLVFLGPLPPTRDGGEFEDILLATALGGDDKSVLFDAVRTGLRQSHNWRAGLDAFARDLRFLALSGEVETAKLAEAETIVRTAYADFLKSPPMGDLSERKSPFVTYGEETAKDPIAASFSAMNALFDGHDPYLALTLPSLLEKVTDATLWSRAASAFPSADQLIVLAVSPDAAALPGACVISTPEQAVNCR